MFVEGEVAVSSSKHCSSSRKRHFAATRKCCLAPAVLVGRSEGEDQPVSLRQIPDWLASSISNLVAYMTESKRNKRSMSHRVSIFVKSKSTFSKQKNNILSDSVVDDVLLVRSMWTVETRECSEKELVCFTYDAINMLFVKQRISKCDSEQQTT